MAIRPTNRPKINEKRSKLSFVHILRAYSERARENIERSPSVGLTSQLAAAIDAKTHVTAQPCAQLGAVCGFALVHCEPAPSDLERMHNWRPGSLIVKNTAVVDHYWDLRDSLRQG